VIAASRRQHDGGVAGLALYWYAPARRGVVSDPIFGKR